VRLASVRPTAASGWKLTILNASALRRNHWTMPGTSSSVRRVTVTVEAHSRRRPVRRRAARIMSANSARSPSSSASQRAAA